jgi:hypothetical protein
MPQVLTTNATIFCPHGGKGTTIPSAPKWQINGGYVAVEGDMGVLACLFAPLPCASYQLQSMGLNATQIDGRKVILVTDFNRTVTGLPLTMIETHPIIDNSSPVPIPVGQPAPPLSPPMSDMVKPVVTSSIGNLAFNKTTMSPATLAVTFTLITAHPMRWILRQIDEPEQLSNNRTSVQPLGLTVTPSGGVWDVSPLTITMTMTAPFMGTLAPLAHRFFMIGVSQRGLSNFAEVVLTVGT